MINLFNKKSKIELSIDLFLSQSNLLYKNVAKEILLAYTKGEMNKAFLLSKEIEDKCDFVSEIIDPYHRYFYDNFKQELKELKKKEKEDMEYEYEEMR